MSEYIGSKCIVCGELFTKNDDIVVCPDCGTPYHRECYFKEGKCINTTLHSESSSWKPDNFFIPEEDNTEIECKNCGYMNANTGLFCKKCGFPLSRSTQNPNSNQRNIPPFFYGGGDSQNPKNEYLEQLEIDGIKISDYSTYIEKNQLYYLPQFLRFSKTNSQLSVNLSAMLFPEYFFFYRKMNLIGCIIFVFKILISVSTFLVSYKSGYFDGTIFDGMFNFTISNDSLNLIGTLSTVLYWVMTFGCATFANWFYFKKAKSDITKTKAMDISDSEKAVKFKEHGGTSAKSVVLAMLIQYLLVSSIFLMIKTGVLL